MKLDTPLTLAISPCPNDTFIFEQWVEGGLADFAAPITAFADVQTLNEAAAHGVYDVIKISCAQIAEVQDQYEVLPCGGAMGFGCGPLLLSSRAGVFDPQTLTLLPGRNTTAALLFRFWATRELLVDFRPFDQVYQGLLDGSFHQGVVIHEHRFTWKRDGLHLLEDLGNYWESRTGCPIPLGVIVAKKSLGKHVISQVTNAIRASLTAAWARTELLTPFIRNHAQETETAVMEAHIRMFVNEFSADIGATGKKALAMLEQCFTIQIRH